MNLKSVVRFFKKIDGELIPLDWAMFHVDYYKFLSSFKKPIVQWTDGMNVLPNQLIYKDNEIYTVDKIIEQGIWEKLDVTKCDGVFGLVPVYEPGNYMEQDLATYKNKLYYCTRPGLHDYFNLANWAEAKDKLMLTTITHFKDSSLPSGNQVTEDGIMVNLLEAGEIDD